MTLFLKPLLWQFNYWKLPKLNQVPRNQTVIKLAAVTWDQVKKIAENKMADLNAFTIESAMRMVAGTARSMGITVKGNPPF